MYVQPTINVSQSLALPPGNLNDESGSSDRTRQSNYLFKKNNFHEIFSTRTNAKNEYQLDDNAQDSSTSLKRQQSLMEEYPQFNFHFGPNFNQPPPSDQRQYLHKPLPAHFSLFADPTGNAGFVPDYPQP